MRIRATVLPAALGMLMAAAGPCAAERQELLARVRAALKTAYYQGILITERASASGAGREEEVARAWFGPDGRQALEIISPAWRRGELYINDGQHRWVVYPQCAAALRLAAGSEGDGLQFLREARLEGTERLDGRETLLLRVDGSRGVRRVWIDAVQYIPLKQEDRNLRGELIFSRALTEVEFPSAPPIQRLSYTPEPGMAVYTDEGEFHRAASLPRVQRGVDFTLRRPSFLPTGLAFARADLMEVPQLQVVRLLYSDGHRGGRQFSFFQYKAGRLLGLPERQFIKEWRGLQVYRWRQGTLEFVLVGNLKPAILRRIAQSVR